MTESKCSLLGRIHKASAHPLFWGLLRPQPLTHGLHHKLRTFLGSLPMPWDSELPQAYDDQYDLLP